MLVDEKGKIIKKSYLNDIQKPILTKKDIISGVLMLTQTVLFPLVLIQKLPQNHKKVFNLDTFMFAFLGQYGKAKYLNKYTTLCLMGSCHWNLD